MAKLIEITGKAISGEWGTDDETGDGTPVLRTTNFTNHGAVDFSNVVTRDLGRKDLSGKFLRHGDIIIEKSGGSDTQPVGRVIFFDGPENTYLFNNFTGLLRVKDQQHWFPRYVFYALLANYRFGRTKLFENRTTGLHNLQTESYVAKTEIRETDVDSQMVICAMLDRLKVVIESRQHQLHTLDTLIKARFVETFGDPELNPMGWPIEALGDLLSVEPQNGLYKPQSDYVQDGTGIPILRIDAFYDGKVTDFSRLKRLNCSDIERSRYLLMENDIVINRVNSIEYLGKCAWITGMIEPTVFESNMMRFHVDEFRFDPCYLTRLLCSSFIYKQILNRAKKAVNQASINQGDVQNFKILVPPIGLQKQYAAFVSQVEKSKVVWKYSTLN